jgi:hypothetical protein
MNDALERFANSGTGIGIEIRENGKIGNWSYDGDDMGSEPEDHLALILETMLVGDILFGNGKVIEKNVGRLFDGHEAPLRKEDLSSPDHKPFVSLQAVFATGPYTGQVATISGVSWGMVFAVQKLMPLYVMKKRLYFPICRLRTKERGDTNNTIDSLFEIIGGWGGWTSRSNFAELLGEDVQQLPAPATAPAAIAAPIARSRGIAAEFTPSPKLDEDLPERIDADPNDPDNIVF